MTNPNAALETLQVNPWGNPMMQLVYLQEGRGYGSEELRRLCFGEKIPESVKDASMWFVKH